MLLGYINCVSQKPKYSMTSLKSEQLQKNRKRFVLRFLLEFSLTYLVQNESSKSIKADVEAFIAELGAECLPSPHCGPHSWTKIYNEQEMYLFNINWCQRSVFVTLSLMQEHFIVSLHNFLSAIGEFWTPLITFAKRLDPDVAPQNDYRSFS